MANVRVCGLVKSFGGHPIIRGVDVEAPDGQFVVLVGPSGCGKSTLLRMVAGLEEVEAGEIWIGPRMVNDVPPRDRDVAMVFQSYALYPHMSVAENLAFSLRLRRRPKAEILEQVARAAAILGLEKLLDRYPRQLSGGQRQRVAMGRALVRTPQVFLFDEPLSNLDAKLRSAMRTEIKELHQRLRTTTLYVTHDQVEAMTMADRIVVLRDGSVEQVGPPLELYDRPANRFVAGFLGSPAMNFLDGRVSDGGLRLASGAVVSGGSALALPAGASATLGIRPEHLRIAAAGAARAIPGVVGVVEPTGSETTIMVRTKAGPLTVVLRERAAVSPGQEVALEVIPGSGHLFDEQGARVASV